MGIYPQPNIWTCGPFALKHALAMLGILEDENDIARVAGTHWWNGTDEIGLGKAARRYGCDLLMIRKHDADKARQGLVGYLRRGIPVLLCINEWSHWVTAVKEEKGKFILLDSQEPEVLTIASSAQLRRMWVYHEADEIDEDTVHTFFDLHPIVPRFRVRTKAKFSVARARFLRRKANRRLAQLWDVYLADLLALCKPKNPQAQAFSMGEFLRRHEQMIVDQVDFWHGSMDARPARQILDNLHFVADTYGLVIHQGDEKRAIAGITAILTLWAAGEYGVDSVYAARKKKRR